MTLIDRIFKSKFKFKRKISFPNIISEINAKFPPWKKISPFDGKNFMVQIVSKNSSFSEVKELIRKKKVSAISGNPLPVLLQLQITDFRKFPTF